MNRKFTGKRIKAEIPVGYGFAKFSIIFVSLVLQKGFHIMYLKRVVVGPFFGDIAPCFCFVRSLYSYCRQRLTYIRLLMK